MPTLQQRVTSLAQSVGADVKAILSRLLVTEQAGEPFLLGSRFQHLDEGTETGSTTGRTSRVIHVSAGRTTRVRFLFANWYMNNQAETNGPNTIYVRAGVEYNGATVQLTFGGATEIALAPADQVWSDWATITIPKGATFYSRTFVRVASGAHVTPRGIVPYDPEWRADGDYTTTATTPGTRSAGMYTFAPIAAQGWGRPQPSVVIFGDSIITGAVDGAGHDYGYATRALAGKVGAINLAKGGASSYDLPVAGKRVALGALADYAIYAFGQNDMSGVTSFATVQANMQARIDALAALGLKVIVVTVPPRSGQTVSGSDWAVSNQTKPNSNFDAGGSWEQTNAWLKSLPSNVYACIDLNEVWSASIGSWQWYPSRVQDGIHPNTAGHDAARDVILDFLKRGGLQNPLALNPFERKTVMLAADKPLETTSLVDVGISFPVRAGAVYDLRMMADVAMLDANKGVRLTLTGPGITSLFLNTRRTNTATTNTYSNGNTAWDTPAASTTTGLVAGTLAEYTAHFVAAADGVVKVQGATNTAATNAAVVKRGSHLEYQRLY